MSQIVITELRAEDRRRRNQLWQGYLDFHETAPPSELHDHLAAPGPSSRGSWAIETERVVTQLAQPYFRPIRGSAAICFGVFP
jgi:hypothetical protein